MENEFVDGFQVTDRKLDIKVIVSNEPIDLEELHTNCINLSKCKIATLKRVYSKSSAEYYTNGGYPFTTDKGTFKYCVRLGIINQISIKPNKTYNLIMKFPLVKFFNWLDEICKQQNWIVVHEFIGVKGIKLTFINK